MPFSFSNIRLTGCILEQPGPNAFRALFEDRSIPDRVDLRPMCSPVEDQGRIGSCTANAAVGALEYHMISARGRAPDLSRLFVYYNARRLRGDILSDSGATISEAMASVLAYGACREDLWPYNPQLFALEPPPHAYQDAKRYEAIQYARVEGGKGSMYALADGLPVVFGTWLPQRCYEEAAETGVIPQPTEAERRGQPASGHAMLIVGYDRPERMFIVRNSWGERWGDRGYCRISFNVMEEFSSPDQFWVIAEMARQGHFRLIRPGRDAESGPSRTAARLREEIRSGLATDLAASSRKIDDLLARRGKDDR